MARYITDPVARECRRENVDPTAFLRVLDALDYNRLLDEAHLSGDVDAVHSEDAMGEAIEEALDDSAKERSQKAADLLAHCERYDSGKRDALMHAFTAGLGDNAHPDIEQQFEQMLDEALAAAKQEGTEAMKELLGV